MSFNKIQGQKPKLVLVNSAPEKAEVTPAIAAKHLAYSQVIKSENLKNNSSPEVSIDQYLPSEVAGKRAAVKPAARTNSQSHLALDGLKSNLKTLNELQARLRFMLTELEDLVQK